MPCETLVFELSTVFMSQQAVRLQQGIMFSACPSCCHVVRPDVCLVSTPLRGSIGQHALRAAVSSLLFSLLFSSGQTAVKLSGAEAADRAQCAAPDKPVGY